MKNYFQLASVIEESPLKPEHMASFLHSSRVKETPHRELLLYASSTVDGNIIAVGQDGLVSIWTTNLTLKRSTLILDENKSKLQNRRMKWVADSILMPHYNKLIIGTCDREMRLYELSNLEPYCQIIGLETMPLHLDYSVRGEGECAISYGDEQGCINILLINSVAETLRNWSKYPSVEEIPTISINTINDSGNINFIRWKVHNDWVTKIKYIHSMESIISSSNDDASALVIGCVSGTKNLKHRLKTLMALSTVNQNNFPVQTAASPPRRFSCDESIFKIHKGVKTFDFCPESNILVTGGLDRNVRLWNPYVPGWALGVLQGHASPVGFVCIAFRSTKIFSVSLDSTIKVWNIEDHSCLLTFIPKVSQIRGEMETCYFSPDLQALYIAAENFGLLKFQHRESQIHVSGMSHNGPVFCCQYNKQLQHVVSCSEDSVIKIWNLKNGQLVVKVHETHGGTAITCMALDANGKRLITGGRDGSLKRWDCRTLSYLDTIKQATSSADEVIACTYTNIYNNSYIISVGWDRKIHAFLDINGEVAKESGSQMDWIENVQHGHKEDILCVAACPPHFLATSSFDGEILIWNLVSGHLCSRLHATSNAAMKGEVEDLAINKIIFLVSRLEKKRTAAILVASGPRGYITFWNIYGRGKQFANFCSCEERSTISDLAVSDNDSLLCTGDQQGCLCIWNMVDYAMNGPEVNPPALLQTWKAHSCCVTSVTLVSEDQLLLTSSLDNSVKLWSLEGEYIGMFGQREPWNIKEKSSWKRSKCNMNSENASESDVKVTTENIAAQREYYSMLSAEMVQDTSTLKIDDEITEELKQRQTRRLKHRSKQYQFTPFQEHASKVMNSYHSLPLCELVCVSTAFHKPDLAAQLDDLFSDGNLIVSWSDCGRTPNIK